MKKAVLIFALYFPLMLNAQRVVILSVNQPPELGFSVSKQDTTINKGTSIVLGTDLFVYGGSGDYSFKWSPVTALSDSTVMQPHSSPSDTITYTVTVTDKNGCSFTVNYTVNVKTDLVNSDLISGTKSLQAVLFPNPSEGKFKVKLTGAPSKKIELTVYDNSGRVIERQTVRDFTGDQTETLQLNLVSGIYTLKINSETETLSRQFIIN